jgi:SAM-dependent methyltransferase
MPAIVDPVLAALDAWAEPDHWAVADGARLAAVRADRASAANEWFEAHADDNGTRSDRSISPRAGRGGDGPFAGRRPLGRLIDIGTGTGRMLELFAPRAEHALGIDRSSEMLRLARAKLERARQCRAAPGGPLCAAAAG